MDLQQKLKLTEYLKTFVSDRRRARFDEVLSLRMNHMQIVLENVYQAHNASAVLRSADCFGVQYVHAIEDKNKYRVSEDVAMGSGNWVSLLRHSGEENNTRQTLTELKQQGFKIVATTPHRNDCLLEDLDVTQKFALVFGTEQKGISEDVFEMADAYVKLPMYGFTESFNISVCAALCMYDLTRRIRNTPSINWHLSEEEKTDIYLTWLRNSIAKVELIEKEYYAHHK
jgi:tRNA (guanosine-2'-O-)-methyltransferase